MAKVPEHKDKLGRPLAVGDCVAYPDGNNTLKIGLIDKLNPKMLRVKEFKKTYTSNKYPHETVKLDGPDISMYILKMR